LQQTTTGLSSGRFSLPFTTHQKKGAARMRIKTLPK
jgi:hypothetical protein